VLNVSEGREFEAKIALGGGELISTGGGKRREAKMRWREQISIKKNRRYLSSIQSILFFRDQPLSQRETSMSVWRRFRFSLKGGTNQKGKKEGR